MVVVGAAVVGGGVWAPSEVSDVDSEVVVVVVVSGLEDVSSDVGGASVLTVVIGGIVVGGGVDVEVSSVVVVGSVGPTVVVGGSTGNRLSFVHSSGL